MLIVDTGVIVAATDRTDRHHQRCVALLETEPGPLVDQALHIEDLTAQDWTRVRQLVTVYSDLPLGGTDASVIAIAERLDQTRVATLDRRHFTIARPAHLPAFELIP